MHYWTQNSRFKNNTSFGTPCTTERTAYNMWFFAKMLFDVFMFVFMFLSSSSSRVARYFLRPQSSYCTVLYSEHELLLYYLVCFVVNGFAGSIAAKTERCHTFKRVSLILDAHFLDIIICALIFGTRELSLYSLSRSIDCRGKKTKEPQIGSREAFYFLFCNIFKNVEIRTPFLQLFLQTKCVITYLAMLALVSRVWL